MSGTAKKNDLSVDGLSLKRFGPESDRAVAQRLQYISWVQDRLWNAHVVDGKIVAEPVFFGPRTPLKGILKTPDGEVELTWEKEGSCKAPGDAVVEIAPQSIGFVA